LTDLNKNTIRQTTFSVDFHLNTSEIKQTEIHHFLITC